MPVFWRSKMVGWCTVKSFAIGAIAAVILVSTVFLVRSCDGFLERNREAGKQEIVVDVQGATIEAQQEQANRNNNAGIWLNNAIQTARDAARVFEQEVSNAKTEEFDLDMPLPVVVADGLRLRVTEAQDRIRAGYTNASNPACPSPAKRYPATPKGADGTQSGGVGK